MKRFLLILLLAVATPLASTSCSTAPSSRVTEVKTLKIVGATAKTAMDAATQLLKDDKITVAQWTKVASFYDGKFQPAFTLAVAAVGSDLTAASPDILSLATQFASLVAELTAH